MVIVRSAVAGLRLSAVAHTLGAGHELVTVEGMTSARFNLSHAERVLRGGVKPGTYAAMCCSPLAWVREAAYTQTQARAEVAA